MDHLQLGLIGNCAVLWAGTEACFSEYLQMNSAPDKMKAGVVYTQGGAMQQAQEELPYLLEIENGIGLISIHGPMSNEANPWDKHYGTASYPAIREAVAYAGQSADVKAIILDIASGGGSVAGVSDTGALIRRVNDTQKPVVAYSDSGMMSAAYWLGSSAGNLFSSSTAMVGSIGVIQMHMERSKMLADMGIGVTVMRAGKFKALANGVEPLTADAKAEIQAQLDASYKVFVSHVADARGLSYDVVDKTMAQGREFFGEQALSAGLVDGILSFDALVAKVQSKIS